MAHDSLLVRGTAAFEKNFGSTCRRLERSRRAPWYVIKALGSESRRGELADSTDHVRPGGDQCGELVDARDRRRHRILQRRTPRGHEAGEIGNVDVIDVDFGQETATERDQP